MKAVGIIAEYNPFHNGHAWQIATVKSRTGLPVIAVMSGNFVQRGEPAIIEKFTRSRLAVRGGADLVLELPFTFACSSAEHFATGAVRLLGATGVTGVIYCGAEYPEILSAPPDISSDALRAQLKTGCSYASAMAAVHPESEMLTPNNILALEYQRAINKFCPHINLEVIKRIANNYHDHEITGNIVSATAVRQALLSGNIVAALACVPKQLHDEIRNYSFHHKLCSVGDLWPLLAYLLRTTVSEQLKSLGLKEGLENRFINAAQTSRSYHEFIDKAKSRRYTYSRLQRDLIQIMIGLPDARRAVFNKNGPQYLRPLAWNETGRKLLKEIAANSSLPLITSPAKFERACAPENAAAQMLSADITATKIHSVISATNPLADFQTKAQLITDC